MNISNNYESIGFNARFKIKPADVKILRNAVSGVALGSAATASFVGATESVNAFLGVEPIIVDKSVSPEIVDNASELLTSQVAELGVPIQSTLLPSALCYSGVKCAVKATEQLNKEIPD